MTGLTSEASILEMNRLSVGYADEPVVTNFSYSIPEGSITTIIGPNGAGKSTLLRGIYGLNRRFGGQLSFMGESIDALTPEERLRRGIGFVPQGRCNFPLMTVKENLVLGGYTLPHDAASAAFERVIVQFPLLSEKLGVLAGNLSGGEQQVLEIAMVLETSPRLLLLDEPSLGLSPANQDRIFAAIATLRDSGLTVLVVEQNAYGSLRISDTGIVMDLGRLLLASPAREILDDQRVRDAYLGGRAE